MRPLTRINIRTGSLLLGAAAIGLVTACGGSGVASATGPATISAASTSAGMVLTGPDGNTVYTLLDSSGKPLPCTGQCPSTWPSVPTSGAPMAASGVTATLTSATAADGTAQAAANGDPLYYYTGDSGSGQVNGQGLTSFGGTWHAIQANGTPMAVSGGGAAQPSSAGNPSNPGGY